MKLKIHSDKAFLPDANHVVMLYPFWGKNPENPTDPTSGRFDRYTSIGNAFLQMTPIQEADIAVFPGGWECVVRHPEALNKVEQFQQVVGQFGKTPVLFFCSDSDEPIPFDNMVVFRTSSYRDRRTRREFGLPAWSEDLVEKHLAKGLPIREKQAKPVVGFCGYAAMAPGQKLKSALRGVMNWVGANGRSDNLVNLGLALRARALDTLCDSTLIKTNFVVRDRFWGGTRHPLTARQEFVRNMVESDYILCTRGAGNFSYRLYETLSMGRIPVFVDTDCVLPYDFAVDWKQYVVWVAERDLFSIGEKVAAFHEHLTSRDFNDLQHECRRLWEQWISPQGFFANFYRHFNLGAA